MTLRSSPLLIALLLGTACGDDEASDSGGGAGGSGATATSSAQTGSGTPASATTSTNDAASSTDAATTASGTGGEGAGGDAASSSTDGSGAGGAGTGGGATSTSSGDGGGGAGPVSGDLDVDYCTPLAELVCGRADDCGCGLALPGDELDVPACIEGYRQRCLDAYAPIDAAVDAGQAYVDPDAAASCVATIAGSTPACERPSGVVSLGLCPAWFWSFDALGDECAFPFCDGGDGWCEDGTCVPRPGGGDDCDQYECSPGLLCVDGTCIAPSGDGVECESDITCRPPLRCIEGLCNEPRDAGDDCAATSSCDQALVCGDGGTCEEAPGNPCSSDLDCGNLALCATPRVCIAPGGVGAPCDVDDACAPGSHCDGGTSACVSYPGLGEDCENGTFCAAGLACDMDFGECILPPGDGDPCAFGPNGPGVCAEGLGCNDFTCGALPGEGDPCTVDYRCDDGLGCAFQPDGSFCVVPGGVGTTCQNDGACDAATHCDFATGTCADDAATGEPCPAGNECSDGDVCGVGGGATFECVAAPELGDPCLFDCGEGLACVSDAANATCVPSVCLEL